MIKVDIEIAERSDRDGINNIRVKYPGFTPLLDVHVQNNDDQITFVAKNGKEIVGYISLRKIQSLSDAELEVFAHPQHEGIGNQLMTFLLSYVTSKTNLTRLTLGVAKENTGAKNWYIKRGFISQEGNIFGEKMAKNITRE